MRIALLFFVVMVSFGLVVKAVHAAGETDVLAGLPTTDGLTQATDGDEATYIEWWGTQNLVRQWIFAEPGQHLGRVAVSSSNGQFVRILYLRNGQWVDANGKLNNAGSTLMSGFNFDLENIDGIKITYHVGAPYYSEIGYRTRIRELRVYAVPDTTPPDVPMGLSALPTNGHVVLDWDASASTDLAGYNVYKNGEQINAGLVPTNIYSLAVPNNETFTWTVTAVDASGNESNHSVAVVTMFDTLSPAAPIGLALEPNGPYSVLAVWSENVEPDLAGYSVYLNSVKLNTTLIAENQYSVGDLQHGNTYNFQVSATDVSGNESALSTPVSYLFIDIPDRPAELRAIASSKKVMLSWIASPGATSYEIFRDDVQIGQVSGVSYTDSGLTNDETYKYDVIAKRADKASPKATVFARPTLKSMPIVSLFFSLADIAAGVGAWFSSLWLILAFAIAISLSFVLGRRVRELF